MDIIFSSSVLDWQYIFSNNVLDWLDMSNSVFDWLDIANSVLDWLDIANSVLDWLDTLQIATRARRREQPGFSRGWTSTQGQDTHQHKF